MKNKAILTLALFMGINLLLLSIFVPFSAGQGYDIVYTDPQGDVVDIKALSMHTSGFEYIDILKLVSSENIIGNQIVLELKVAGVITNSEEIDYYIILMDSGELVYTASYSNGICTGFNLRDGTSIILQASGTGTDTLEVRVQKNDVGDIADFDIFATTQEYRSQEDNNYLDYIPDSGINLDPNLLNVGEMPVSIVNPKSGATAYGLKTLSGVTKSDYNMISVEIQFDSKSNDAWVLTSTSDGWKNWSMDWDLSDLTQGKHTLNARAYNGTEYFFDSVILYVDDTISENPPTANMPKIVVGEVFRFSIQIDIPDLGGYASFSSTGNVNYTVDRVEEINVGGRRYETYAFHTQGIQESKINDMSSTVIQNGTQWLRTSDLSILKVETNTIQTTMLEGVTNIAYSNYTVTYEPPIDNYDFPIYIGEQWGGLYTITTLIEGTGDSLDKTITRNLEFEALHVEEISVPAGSFETFVLWSQDPFSADSPVACNLEYYSPKLGFFVKMETYDSQRNLVSKTELVSYEKEALSEEGDSQDIFGGGDFGLLILLILLIVFVVVVVCILLIRRKNEEYPENLAGEHESMKNESRPQVHSIKSNLAKTGNDGRENMTGLHFVKCPRCSHLLTLETVHTRTKCPYCGMVWMS